MPKKTDEQVQYQVSRMMNKLARRIQSELKRGTGQDLGFSLVVFPPGANELTSYISNCKREEVKEALRQLLEYWDQDGPDVPAHERN